MPNSPMLRTKSRSQLRQDIPTKNELIQSKIQVIISNGNEKAKIESG